MKGLVKTARGPGNIELRELERPTPGPREVLVEVTAAGICGSDLHIKQDEMFYTPPVIMGHEYSGIVVELGEGITRVALGDRVVSPATAYCGQCHHCKTGSVNRCTCEDKRILGVSLANGAFAKYIAVPEYIIHKVPDNLPLEEAALAEPTACVVHLVVERTEITPGDVVVVQGPGTMGLVATQVARAMGAGKVIITGMTSDRWKMDIAEKNGADVTIDVQTEPNAVEIVKEHSEGLGADVVIEASGAGPARRQSFDFVKTAGHIALLGVQGRPTEIDLDQMIIKELSMVGTWGTIPSTWVITLRMMASGQIDVKPLVTHRISLDDWEQGFELMEAQKAIKVLFTELE